MALASLRLQLQVFATIWLSLPLLFCAVKAGDDGTVVDLGYARYRGTFNETSNTTTFLGIRYAAPPIGGLRFQAPQAPLDESALGVQLADTMPSGCPQADEGNSSSTPFAGASAARAREKRNANTSEPEDCLFLNVFVSGKPNYEETMPVIVYIHGGGYIQGSEAKWSGNDLIKEGGGGLVIVNMEYRLGVFGFLPGSEVKRKGALNAGLLDQQASLEWVQQHIHLFGGNPDMVTVWGESAGAGSVLQHMVAHGGNTQPPLFRQAITSSTFVPSQYHFDDSISEQIYDEIVRSSGCNNSSDTFQCLAEADVDALQSANEQINLSGFYGTFTTVPVVDGDFIVERPMETILKGKLNGERYLGMTNAAEGDIFVDQNIIENMTLVEYVKQLLPNFNDAQVNDTVCEYSNSDLQTVYDQAIGIYGDSVIVCPTYAILQYFNGVAFKGEFAVPPATHDLDLMYYYPSVGIFGPFYSNLQFDASFAAAFTGFAKFGDPNVHPVPDVITPPWYAYNKSNTEMVFNATEDGDPDIRSAATNVALLKRCSFWQGMASSYPQ